MHYSQSLPTEHHLLSKFPKLIPSFLATIINIQPCHALHCQTLLMVVLAVFLVFISRSNDQVEFILACLSYS